MQDRSPAQEDADLYHAAVESVLIHGGGSMPLNPLEELIEAETSQGVREHIHLAASEILLRLLTFAADGLKVRGMSASWRTVTVKIPPLASVRYQRENTADEIPWPYVELVNAEGQAITRWEPARLKMIRAARPKAKEKSSRAIINILDVNNESAALRVGTRIISLAALAGVASIRELTGAKIAERLGVTRQAVSLTNKAMEQKIKSATGAKSGSRSVRHKADPRKGKTIEEIHAERIG